MKSTTLVISSKATTCSRDAAARISAKCVKILSKVRGHVDPLVSVDSDLTRLDAKVSAPARDCRSDPGPSVATLEVDQLGGVVGAAFAQELINVARTRELPRRQIHGVESNERAARARRPGIEAPAAKRQALVIDVSKCHLFLMLADHDGLGAVQARPIRRDESRARGGVAFPRIKADQSDENWMVKKGRWY